MNAHFWLKTTHFWRDRPLSPDCPLWTLLVNCYCPAGDWLYLQLASIKLDSLLLKRNLIVWQAIVKYRNVKYRFDCPFRGSKMTFEENTFQKNCINDFISFKLSKILKDFNIVSRYTSVTNIGRGRLGASRIIPVNLKIRINWRRAFDLWIPVRPVVHETLFWTKFRKSSKSLTKKYFT